MLLMSGRQPAACDLQGSARTTARHADGGERGAPLQIQVAGWSWQADLGRQGGHCASIIPLHPLIMPLFFAYYPSIIPLLYPLMILLHGVI